jgi:hypothetical protein
MEPVENWDLLPFSFPIQKIEKKKKSQSSWADHSSPRGYDEIFTIPS